MGFFSGGTLSGIGAVAANPVAAIGTAAAAGNVGVGLLNYGEQRKQNTWSRHAQEYAWAREDTAVQRRAADLRAAGLSPVLAAGQGASTMSPISLNAPRLDVNPSELAATAMTMMTQEAEISRTKEQEKLNAAQKRVADLQAAETAWNLKLAKEGGIPTTQRGTVADVVYGVGAAEQAAEKLRLKMEERKRIENEAARQRDRERNPEKYKKTTTGVKG